MPSLPKNLNNSQRNDLSIKEASKFVGVSTKTLRRWEEKGVIQPARTVGGHRRYSLDVLKRFKESKGSKRLSPFVKPIISKSFADAQKVSLAEAKIPEIYQKLPSPRQYFASLHKIQKRVLIGMTSLLAFSTLVYGLTRIEPVKEKLHEPISKLAGFVIEKMGYDTVTDQELRMQVLGIALDTQTFKVNVESLFAEVATFDGDVAVNSGNIVTSSDTFNFVNTSALTLNIGGEASEVNIGGDSGTTTVGNDLAVLGNLDVTGEADIPTLIIGGDTFTDLTGTGLAVSANTLQTTLGTSIESSEITDDTIKEVDLNASNSPTSGFALTYNSGTSGFTWTDLASANLFTDAGTVVYLTTTTDSLTIGSATELAKLAVDGDTDEIQFLVQGNATQTSNLVVFEQSGGTDVFTLTNAGNLTIAGDLAISGGNVTTAVTFDSTLTTTGTLTANGALVANSTFTLGDAGDTGSINTSDWVINTTGDMTGIGNITSDGIISFNPTGAGDIILTTDNAAGSFINITGLTSGTGSSLCVDGSNNVITCSAGSGSDLWTLSGATIYPDLSSYRVGVGTSTAGDIISSLYVTRTLADGATGKAVAIFNQTENQDIISASASGTTVANLDRSGNLAIEGQLSDLSTATLTINDALSVLGALTVIGVVSDSDSNLVLDDTVDLGSATTGVNVTTAGVISDIDGNLVLSDTVDIGSTTTGVRVTSAGVVSDIDGDLVLSDQLNLGSSTTGLLVTVDGVISDIDDSSIVFTEALNIGGITGVSYNAISDAGTAGSATSDNDLYVEDILEVDGGVFFSPAGTADISFTTDADSFLNITGLTSAAGSGLCVDGSNNVITCSAGSGSDVWTLSGSVIYPDLSSYNVLVGSVTAGDAIGNFTVTGTETGKALAVFNDTGTDQNIITASASGTTVANLDRSGNLAIEGQLSDLSTATLTINDALSVLGAVTVTGVVSDSDSSLVLDDTVDIGSSTTGVNVTTAGVISDIDGNLVLSDTVDLGSAATGVNITTAGVVSDIDGDLVLSDQLNLGSSTTGLLITTDGVISDIDDSSIVFTEALNIGGITGVSYNAISDAGTAGSATSDNDLYVEDILEVDGGVFFSPAGTADISITTDADSFVNIVGLASGSGSSLCVDGSNNVVTCSAGSGSDLWTLSGSAIFPDLATYNVLVGSVTAGDAIGNFTVTGTETGKALAVFNDTGTDQNILTASASGTTVANLDRSGNLAIEGQLSDLSTATLTINDALSVLGALTVTGVISDSDSNLVLDDTVDLGSATTGVNVTTAGVISDIDGNLVLSDTVDIGSTTTGVRVTSAGVVSDIDGDLVLSDQLNLGSSTTGLLVTVDGVISDIDDSSIVFTEALNIGGITGVAYNAISDAGTAGSATSDNDLYIEDILEVDGGVFFSPAGTADISFTTDADSFLNITGLTSAAGSGLCVDGSNNVVTCTAGSGSDVWTLSGSVIYPDLATYNVLVGSVTAGDSVGQLTVTGTETGKALAVFNDTGTDQNILTASASGTTVANLDRSGNLAIEGQLSDLSTATLTINDALSVLGALTVTGVISDSDSNLVLDDTVDIGSAATGVNITTAGVLSDIDGDLILSDQLNLGSSTTGLLITTDGVISDIDDSSIVFTEALNIGGITGVSYNAISDAGTAGSATSDNDLYVEDILEVDGGVFFSPAGTADISITTDADSFVNIVGLASGSGSSLCVDGSNNVVTCSAGSGSDLWTLSGSAIFPDLATYNVLVGSVTAGDAIGNFTVTGTETGKALAVFNDTGTDQNILTASASGTTVLNLSRAGLLTTADLTLGLNDTSATISTQDTNEDLTIDPNGTGAIILTATTGLNITSGGLISDLDGNLVLDDQTDIGSTTTGLRVTTGGQLTDIDAAAISIDDDISFVDAQSILTTTGDLTLSPADEVVFGDAVTFIIGGHAGNVAYNVISDSGGTPGGANINSDDDLFIEGALEVDSTLYADGGIDTAFTAGSVIFAGTSGVLAEDNTNFFWDDTANKLGIGLTPVGKLHVEGQCVIAGTKIRRRRKKKNGDWEEEDVPVEEIEPGDEVLSLNQESGNFEWHKVEKTMAKGIQPGIELVTSTGKRIVTTKKHPYLVIEKPKVTYGTFEVDLSVRFDKFTQPTVVGLAWGEKSFSVKIDPNDKKKVRRIYQKNGVSHLYQPEIYAYSIVEAFRVWRVYPSRIIIDKEYPGYENLIRDIIALSLPETEVEFGYVGKGIAHETAYQVYKGRRLADVVLVENSEAKKERPRAKVALRVLTPRTGYRGSGHPHGHFSSELYCRDHELSRARWLKVSEVRVGQYIATIDGFEKITGIREVGRLPMYDLTISNTHNFVANNIVAHNTTGKALVILNETGDQNILAASASGTTVARLSRSGELFLNTTTANADIIEIQGNTTGAGTFTGTLTIADLTADRTWTIPDATGNVCLSSGNCAGGAGGSKWTDDGAITYLTSQTDNLAVGGTDSTSEFFIDIANGGTLTLNSTGDTENVFDINANSLTTGSGIDVSSTATAFNGELLVLNKTGASGSTAFTSDIANITYSQTFDGGVGLNSTGNVLDISRAITLNVAQTHTVSGAGVTISDSGTQTLGTLTWTGDTVRIAQNYLNANAAALNITTASTDAGTSNFALRVNDDGTFTDSTPFVVDEAGNVGIGTTSPSEKLEVAGNIYSSGVIKATGGSETAPSFTWTADTDTGFSNIGANTIRVSGGGVVVWDMDSTSVRAPATGAFSLKVGAGTAALPTYSFTDDLDVGMFRAAADEIGFSTAGVERARINSTGNVGIGDTSPDAKLEVSGAVTGKALVILNETGDQAILTASASGTTVARLSRSGELFLNTTTANADVIEIQGNTTGAGTFTGTLTIADLTADRTWSIPDATGDVCLSSGNCAGGAGGSKWTDSGTVTYLTNTTDDLVVGATTPSANGSKITFDGDEDEIQLEIRGFSTQTSNLILVEQDAGADVLTLSNAGLLTTSDLTLGLNDTSATISTFDTDENLTIDPNGTGTIILTAPTVTLSGTTTLTASSLTTISCAAAGCIDSADIVDATITGDDIAPSLGGLGIVLTAATPDVLDIDEIDVADGVGATSNNSGFEFGGTGAAQIGLLQGCADTQILKWVDATSVWNCAADAGGAASGWTDDGTTVRLDTATDFVAIGANTADGKLGVTGARTGQALVIFNETGDQNILVASASGTTRFSLNREGSLTTYPITSSSSTQEGTVYYDSDDDQLKVYANGKWQADRTMATKIVGTTNGSGASLISEKADYVCGASDCDTTIESAITALPAGGGAVVLLEGTYVIDSDGIDITKSNVTLMGVGRSTILQRGYDTATLDGVLTVGDGGTTAVAGVTIKDLAVDGVKATYAGIENYGIRFNNRVTYSAVIATYTHDNDGAGIDLNGNSNANTNNLIQGNDVRSNDQYGVALGASNNNFVINNNIQSNGTAGNGYALAIFNSNNNTFSDNNIQSSANDGINFAGVSGADNNTINGNNIQSNGGDGIEINSSDNNSISYNVIYENSGDGINVASGNNNNNIISSNRIYDSSGAGQGIDVASGTGNYLIGNEISGAGFSAETADAGTGTTIQHRDQFEVETARTSGDQLLVDWTGATSLAGAASGINITASDITGNGQNFYGLNISDLGTAGAGSEYGIYVQGTDWDYALYVDDNVYINSSLAIGTGLQPVGKLDVSGAIAGKALTILNETGDQNILTASASGTTQFNLTRTGTLEVGDLTLGLDDTSATITTSDTEDLTIDPASTGNIILTATTGLNITDDGVITDIDDAALTITDDLAVNGATSADITSTTTTATLFDTTVTSLSIGSAATTFNLADAAITGTIDIGGVTSDGTTTVNIATNGAANADIIAIGNANAATTLALTGGNDWSITAGGVITVLPAGTGTFLDFDLETEWTAGDLVNADWDSATTQTAALTAINLDFTNFTSVAGSTTYGILINDLAAQTTSTEYAIYQEGTNWDRGALFADSVQLGENGADGQLILFNELGGTDFTVTFNLSGTQGGNITYTLPPDDGAADNYVLTTDGSGVLNWEAVSGAGGITGAGTATQIAYFDTASSITSEASGFVWDPTNNRLGIGIDAPVAKLHLTGAVTGKALAIFDETGDQNILTASASGTTVFNLARTGGISILGSPATAIDLSAATTTTDIILDDGLTLSQTSDQDLDIVEFAQTLNLDFAETEVGTITISSASEIALQSTDGDADAIDILSSGGGIDITATGGLAGEDIDIAATGTGTSVNISAAEAVVDAITLTSSADASGIRISAGDTLPAALANGNDIELRAEDDFILNFATGSNLTLDAAATDTTLNTGATTGVAQLLVDSALPDTAGGTNQGFYLDYEAKEVATSVNVLTYRAARIDFTNTETDSADITYALSLNNVNTATGAPIDALIALENNDIAADNVVNGIVFLAGGAATPDFTNGINFDAADFTTEIVLENAETIANQSDGTITLGANSGAVTLSLSGTAATISNTASTLAINAFATGLNLQADGTIDVNLAGGSGATGCTVANSTGNLTCSGSITTTATSGTQGWWQRNTTSLAPATVTDEVVLGGNTTTVFQFEVNGAQIGKALVILNETGDQAIFVASESGTLRFIIDDGGEVGIGLSSPDDVLDITQTTTTGSALEVYRNLAAASTDSPLVNFVQDNAGDDQDVLQIQNDGTGEGLYIGQAGTGRGLMINQNGTENGLYVYSNVGATANSNLVNFTADNSAFDQSVLTIQNDGTGTGLDIANNGTGVGLYVNQSTTGTNSGLGVYSNVGATANSSLVNIYVDNTAFDLDALQVYNDGTGVGAYITQGTTGTSQGLYVYSDVGATANSALAVFQADNAAFDQNVVNIYNDGTGDGLFIQQGTTGTGYGLHVYSNVDVTASLPLVNINADNSTFDQNVVNINNDGTGNALNVGNLGTGDSLYLTQGTTGTNRGLYLYSNVDATANQSLALIQADNSAFDQVVLSIANDGTNVGLYINQGNTGINNGLQVYSNVDATATNPLVLLQADNSAFDQKVVSILNDGTEVGLDISQGTTGTSNGLFVYSDVGATANGPLAVFYADNTAFDQPALRVRNDGAAAGLEIANNGTGEGLFITQSTTGTANALHISTDVGATANSALILLQTVSSSFDQNLMNIQNNGTGTGIDLSQGTTGTGKGLYVYSNVAGTANQPLVDIVADDVNFDQTLFRLQQDGGADIFEVFDGATEVFTIADQGAVTFDPITTSDITFTTDGASGSYINISGLSASSGSSLCIDGGNNVVTCSAGSGSDVWTLSGTVIYPDSSAYNVLIGSQTAGDAIGNLTVTGAETGKALVVFNETGDQAIFVASESGTTRFIIEDGGNVGVGIADPGSLLHLVGSSPNLRLQNSGGTDTGKISFYDSTPNEQGKIQWVGTTGDLSILNNDEDIYFGAGSGSAGTQIQFGNEGGSTVYGYFITGTTNTGDFAVDTNTLYVDASANSVGIGTAVPGALLEVWGSGGTRGILIQGDPSVATSTLLDISATGSDNTQALLLGSKYIYTNTINGQILFIGNDLTSANAQVTIGSSGNVGIGNTSPVGKLDVSGAVTGKALVILNETGDQAILVASRSGTTVLTLGRTGDLDMTSQNTAESIITSDLSGGARTADVLTITQADNATFNSTGNLLQLTNADTGSTTAVLRVDQISSGVGLVISGVTTGADIQLTSALTSGIGIDITGPNTSGSGITVRPALSGMSGTGINIANTESGGGSNFSGDLLAVNMNATVLGGVTPTHSGNYIDVLRSYTSSGASTSLTVSGDLITFSSNCTTASGGACTDTSDILELTQSYGSATGSILNITPPATTISGGALEGVNIGNITTSGGTDIAIQVGSGWDTDIAFVDSTVVLDGPTSSTLTLQDFTTLSATSVTALNCTDCIDWDDIDDTMLLDAATEIALGASNLTVYLSTGGNFLIQDGGVTFAEFSDVGTITLGKPSSPSTINIGIGTQADTINIGTGATTADVITFGNTGVATTFDFNSGAATVNALDLVVNSLSTGYGLGLTSTSTALTTGRLLSLDWSPGSTTTATGDLFRLNIGPNGNVTNLLNITDNGSTLFRVAEAQIESAVPHSFTAAGDVTMAYDLVFTNQTASFIKTNAPFTLEVGESFENNNLTLKTFGTGDIVFDNGGTTIMSVDGANDRVGIGTTSPVLKFHLSDTQSATASGMIENTNTGTDADGLVVKLGFTSSVGSACDTGGACNEFVTFERGDGLTIGKIFAASTTGVTYKTTGTDFAEYFTKDPGYVPDEGDVVTIDAATQKARAATQENDPRLVGIISINPGYAGGFEGPDKALVGLVGQVPIKIAPHSKAISAGDFLTSSSHLGRAVKAQKAGAVVAKALESWDPGSGKDKILAYINVSYHDPDVYLTDTGNLEIVASSEQLVAGEDPTTSYQLQTTSGNIINRVGAFAELVVGNIRAGYVEVSSLVSDSLISKFVKTDKLETQLISPLAGESDVVIKVGQVDQVEQVGQASGFGRLLVQNPQGETVFSIDEAGNATAAGELASDSLVTNEASIAGTLRAGKIYADEVITKSNVTSQMSIVTREEIEALLHEAETDRGLLEDARAWNINSATASGSLNELALENLYVTGTAAIDNLSLTKSVVIGGDLVITSSSSESVNQVNQDSINLVNSINSLTAPLSLQSAGAQPIHLMAGLITIDTDGNVSIAGNLAVGGQVSASGLTLKSQATSYQLPATESGFGKLLTLFDSQGQETAFITATGAATFASIATDKIAFKDDPTATASGTFAGLVYSSSATAGTARVPSGANEVIIRNPNITPDSLVFLTPTSPTSLTLYLKEQTEGEIKVGFDIPTTQDVSFNWWVVELVARGGE